MSEFAEIVVISGTVNIPVSGPILGIYAPGATIDIDWVFNGGYAPLCRGVEVWEPPIAFNPRDTSYLSITSASAVTVTIRRQQ